MATALKIQRWSKSSLARHRAEQSRGIIQPLETIKTLAQYHVRGASFRPVELKLEAGLPEADWMQVARAVASVRECAHFWLGDLMAYGVKVYGVVTAYDLARQATGLPESSLRNAYWCSRKYLPEQRKPALSYCHHLVVAKYPDEGREKILNEAIALGLTTRQCLEMARAEYPQADKPKPKPFDKRTTIEVRMWPEAFERLKKLARQEERQLPSFCSRIIEEWLTQNGHGDCIRYPQTTAERRAAWEADGLCNQCGSHPHLEGRKICESCRQVRNEFEKISYRRTGSGRWRRRHEPSTIVAASAN